jgi:hypothetical protein
MKGNYVCPNGCGLTLQNVKLPVYHECPKIDKTTGKKKVIVRPEPPSRLTTDCIHLGEKTEWKIPCSCPSSTRTTVYRCNVHGLTTIPPVVKRNWDTLPEEGLGIIGGKTPPCCVTCEHMGSGYEKRLPSDGEPSSAEKPD